MRILLWTFAADFFAAGSLPSLPAKTDPVLSTTHAEHCRCVLRRHHSDNFTIVTAELSWLALTAMIGLSLFARRAAYELFYYVHVPVGLFFLGAALIHAWSFWYYVSRHDIAGIWVAFFSRCQRDLLCC